MNVKCAVITIANRPQRGYNIFLESCRLHQIEPVILGMGEQFKGYTDKIPHLERFIKKHSKSYTHILFCDAYDVAFTAGLDEVMKTYLSLKSPILFSAEKNCWPDDELTEKYPAVKSPYRFLNSGLWIGEVGAVKKMIRQLALEFPGKDYSDQRLYTRAFLNKKALISLDHDCQLFQSMHGLSPQDLLWDGSRVKNCITRTFPLIFHGNGYSNMYFVLSKLGLILDFKAALNKAVTMGQMEENQYVYIADLIKSIPNCSVLMIGPGHDADLWYNCSQGNITFVEDTQEWSPQLPVQIICPDYKGHVAKWLETVDTPARLKSSWDVVIVDGPHGYEPNHHGRQESIVWASQFARTTVFVHDYDRMWERQLCDHYLGLPSNLISSDKNNHILAAFNLPNRRGVNITADKISGPVPTGKYRKLRRLLRHALANDAENHFSDAERTALRHLQKEFAISRKHRTALKKIKEMGFFSPAKINLGSGKFPKDGYLNIDISSGSDLTLDLRKGLPFESGCCEIIFSEHFFEHLDYPDPIYLLFRECLRVLKPGGILRFSVPDTEWPLLDYKNGPEAGYFVACEKYSKQWCHPKYCSTRLEHINYHFRQGGQHRFAYDEETLKKVLTNVGFLNIQRVPFDPKSDSQDREHGSLIISAQKMSNETLEKTGRHVSVGKNARQKASRVSYSDDFFNVEAIISCVNYSDFLRLTLPVTTRFLKSVTVLTSPDDMGTLNVCRRHQVPVHTTNVWYKDGATFNKAAALNEYLDQLKTAGYKNWLLFLDADIILSESFASEIPKLNKRALYSIPRRLCDKKSEWNDFVSKKRTLSDFRLEEAFVKNGMMWGVFPTSNPAGLSGYFQLWNLQHGAGMKKYPLQPNAANYDIEFALSFPAKLRKYIKKREVLHLGEKAINWNGRISGQW